MTMDKDAYASTQLGVVGRIVDAVLPSHSIGDPVVAEAYVRLNALLPLTVVVWVASGIQYGLVGRYRGFAIHAIAGILVYGCRVWAGRQRTLIGLTQAAHVSGAIIALGLFIAAVNNGGVGSMQAWYLCTFPAWGIFLISERHGAAWVVPIVVLVSLLALVETYSGIRPEYIVGPWETMQAHLVMTVVLTFFAGATRRSSIDHRATIARHEQLLGEQNTQLRHEISQRERARGELTSALRSADQASRTKSRFLASMSHELRTPLNAIIGYTELILEEGAAGGARDALVHDLHRIVGSSHHLIALINELLDLEKIEAGQLELSVERFELAPLVTDLVGTMEPLARRRGTVVVAEGLDAAGSIESDSTRIGQVLLNILSNAVKFTDDGTITVSMSREVPADGSERVVFRVTDTGIGMTQAQLATAFEPFRQGDASTSKSYGGTGLGLAITRDLVTVLGGAIELESEVGVGTTVMVQFPTTIPSTTIPSGVVGS